MRASRLECVYRRLGPAAVPMQECVAVPRPEETAREEKNHPGSLSAPTPWRMVPIMRLVLDSDPRLQLVRSYGDGAIVVGEQQLTRPCIIFPDRLIVDWSATSILTIDTDQAAALCAPGTGVVLLGEGTGTV